MDPIFDDNQPIYVQIKRQIYADILRGLYPPGGKLPATIEMAMQFKVNHNTIQRVYLELIREGIVVSRRGEGTFVTEDKAILDALQDTLRSYVLDTFVNEMLRLGYREDELAQTVVRYLKTKPQENHKEEK
jgi:GntR family transcriptional regulator